ncbi:MAG: hypothetical protein ACFFEY_13710 [Candidatus Thorarchaeota archaeon]
MLQSENILDFLLDPIVLRYIIGGIILLIIVIICCVIHNKLKKG